MHPSVRQCVVLGAPFPGVYNLDAAWLASARVNWPTKDVVGVGDSTMAGHGAGEGGTVWTNSINHAVPKLTADLLAADGFTARGDGWYASGQDTSGTIADFALRNTNNVVNTGWAILTTPAETVGGSIVRNNTNAATMELTAANCDQFMIGYRRGTGVLSMQIDAESATTADMGLATTPAPTNGIQRLLVTSGGGVGTHTLKLSRSSGDVQIAYVEPRRSAGGEKRILNLGRSGNDAAIATDAGTNTSHFVALKSILALRTAPLVLVNLGINDQNREDGVSWTLPLYKSRLETLIDGIVTAGGLPMLIGHHPTSTTPSQAYRDARYEVARTKGIPLLDLVEHFGTFAAMVAAGYYYDGSSHLNATGYGAVAQIYRDFFERILR